MPRAPSNTRRSRGPARIPRPLNSFFIFREERSIQLRAKCGYLHETGISRTAAKEWKDMDNSDKAPYERKAEKAKLEHAAMYPDYKYTPMTKLEKQQREEEKLAKKLAKEEAQELKKSGKARAMGPSASLNGFAQEAPSFISSLSMAGPSAPLDNLQSPSDAMFNGGPRGPGGYYRPHTFGTGGTQQESGEYTEAPPLIEPQPWYNGVQQPYEHYEADASQAYHSFNFPMTSMQNPDAPVQRYFDSQQYASTPLSYNAQAEEQHDFGEAPVGALEIDVGEMGAVNFGSFDASQWGNLDLGQWPLDGLTQDGSCMDMPVAGPSTQVSTVAGDAFGFGDPVVEFAHADNDSTPFFNSNSVLDYSLNVNAPVVEDTCVDLDWAYEY